MEEKRNTINVVMLPWLAHGHISPFLELAKKLTNKNFHIYICSTPINLSSIKKNVTKEYCESIELVELHLPSLPNLPPHYHTTNGLPHHLTNTLIEAFQNATPEFSKILQTLNPDLVIYDLNMTWAAEFASSINIPAVQFLTFSIAMIVLLLHMFNKPGVEFPFPEIYMRQHEMLQMQKLAMENSKVNMKDSFMEAIRQSRDIILVKDFEVKYMDYLSELVSKKIVPIGSLVHDSIDQSDVGIMQWLDKKEKGSSVFVSFGSEWFLSQEEIHEVAQGLELSKVNFIWVIRFPQDEKISIHDVLPQGFLERVGERGMVLEKWAPQATILQHTSIGGFVSHCGWGSLTESMKFGVPIIAMPMCLDQPINARIVEHIGMGVEALRDENGKLQSEEIAKVIREVVIEESGEGVRKKARELSEKMKMKGDEEIDGVVEELVALCNNK
ncbi:UDP-glucosyltransferase 29-like [Solanum stenotomum]|uniref:UDP-glucosyltransferase 29-like n=1 Tax=Solanum stenotomum TaxID=172797 RepID=UPI0020D13696|nr:UDP-glucosyltransferase 29-like [Solanum stenotomum]